MKVFNHEGVRLHYSVAGARERQAIVFCNSLGTDFRIWDDVVPRLSTPLRVVRYDKRGHGLSDAAPAPYELADHVGDLAGLLDHLEVREAIVCGLSVGGMIAQSIAAERPDLVRALMLCDTAHRIGPAEVWAERIKTIEDHGMERLIDPVLERWFTPQFHDDRADELSIWRNMLIRTSTDGYAGTCAAIRDADLTESTSNLRVPTLCVCGSHDGATPPELVQSLAGLIPGARYEPIEACGHLPCIEQAESFAKRLNKFVDRVLSPDD